ncbi:MAG: hypothetical protein E7C86_03755 [Paeniclostridium sordellii]|nr:hypothetical protein [Paeniclostridium sordellii]
MYAYYCLHKFHWAPSKFANLPLREKALVIEMIDERLKEEKKSQSKIKGGRR